MPTINELKMMQSLPLDVKVMMTQVRIREFIARYGIENVYISFSGGKDSLVLLTLARQLYPDIEAVFFDTGLEHPEIKEFVRTIDNVKWIRPKMTFFEVIKKYGYPIISKEVADAVYYNRDEINGCDIGGCEEQFSMQKVCDTLESFINKIENETLVELPCKVGDKLYLVYSRDIEEWEITNIQIGNVKLFRLGHKGTDDYAAVLFKELGEYAFLTKAEAEKRLKKLRGEK